MPITSVTEIPPPVPEAIPEPEATLELNGAADEAKDLVQETVEEVQEVVAEAQEAVEEVLADA